MIQESPNKKVGRLLMTGEETDKQVQHYLTELRKRGCIINTSVAIAVDEGILLNKDANLLAANGSGINLMKDWAKYLFKRMGLVKRKSNTKAKVDVEQFDEMKRLFHQDIRSVAVMDEAGPEEAKLHWSGQLDPSVEHALQYNVNYTHSYYSLQCTVHIPAVTYIITKCYTQSLY